MAEEQTQGVRPCLEVQQEVRRLFQELVHQPWGGQGGSAAASWQLRCDMVETDDAIVVDVELPGVKRDVHSSAQRRAHVTGEFRRTER